MTRDDLIQFGQLTWRNLKPGSTVQFSTNTVAALVKGDGELKPAYDGLRKLAESGFPAATRGPEKEVTRFGKKIKQRPWLWQRPASDDGFNAWLNKVSTEKRAAGPYAAIEEQIAALEKRILALESNRL